MGRDLALLTEWLLLVTHDGNFRASPFMTQPGLSRHSGNSAESATGAGKDADDTGSPKNGFIARV